MALRILLAALGLTFALLGAEAMARLADGGAFPFLDIYETDGRYGVRLAADATTRVRSRGGNVTTVTINALGFRASASAASAAPPPEVLLLGDSMVFGYGVDDQDTMAARLTERGVPALAVAVPSWGPEESARAAEALVPELAPRAVVFFAHLGNDWLEADVPNAERSEARDGWLVRRRKREPAESSALSSLLAGSHLWFALRSVDARLISRTASGREPTLGAPAAEQMLVDLQALGAARPPHRSRLTRHLARVREACAGRCAVVVAVLPMDVQVDPSAWAKYRRAPRDLSPLDRLGAALLADAGDLPQVDLASALRKASPGAFLADDPHLSARGHLVVADALLPLLERGALARTEVLR